MNSTNIADHLSVVDPSSQPFSSQIRRGTTSAHSNAEHSSAMTDLIKGELPIDGFVRMQTQVAFVYQALEDAADALKEDPIAGPFIDDRLRRTPSLRRDLELLGAGDIAAVEPNPSTQRYCEQITAAAAKWSPGLIAHHYTRYLGDLSGGQHICRVVERTYGIDRTSGSSFFHFVDIEDADDFKKGYRTLLDAMPLNPEEREMFIAEVSTAYAMSTELFLDLD
ncbi:MAG: biliverdin-producing heme oxygenase [Microthrixaceae bacterium]